MRFVFDENHPAKLARMIAVLAEGESYQVGEVRGIGLQGKSDPEILAEITRDGGQAVLITVDRAMRRRNHEVAAIRRTGAIVIIGVSNWNQSAGVWDRARMMLWWWPTIVESAKAADPSSFLELPWRSRTGPLTRWRA